jgi:cell division protease FtsH
MGYLFPGDRPEYSEDTAQVIDEEAGRMLAEARDRATQILNQDQQLLQNLSRVLMAREVIEGAELKRLVDGEIPIPSDEELDRETEERAKHAAEETARIERERARSAETGPSIISSDGAEGVAGDGDGRRPARVPGAADTEEIPPRPD